MQNWSIKHNPIVSSSAKAALYPSTARCKSYIFCATTGRSGSKTLASILGAADGVRAYHEPWPPMNGAELLAAPVAGSSAARRAYDWHKAVSIRAHARGALHYVETNHLFIKTFCQYVFDDFGERVKVVHLKRDPEKVAESMLRLGTIPGIAEGRDWYLDPDLPYNLVHFPRKLRDNRAARCLWYCYEIDARVAHWKAAGRFGAFVEFDIEDASKPEAVLELFARLGLEYRADLGQLSAMHLNRKSEAKVNDVLRSEIQDAHFELMAALQQSQFVHPFPLRNSGDGLRI